MDPLVVLGFFKQSPEEKLERLCNEWRRHLNHNDARLHLFEGAVHVVRDLLDLQLLVDQLVLNLVDPDVQPLDVHLRILCLSLCRFQPGIDRVS